MNKQLKLWQAYLNCVNQTRFVSLYLNHRQKEKFKSGYTTIYNFSYIRVASLVNRLKYYQTILTAVTSPGALALNYFGLIGYDHLLSTVGIGITGCISLYSLGLLTDKIVGFVYFNETTNMVKIAYIDFWGNRKDIEVPAGDIIPFNEAPVSILDPLYLKVRRYSTKDILRINMKHGVFVDKKMKQIF